MSKAGNIYMMTDEQLMGQLIDTNDHAALTELYRRYSQRLLGFFIKMFKGDVQKSQDFLQELFIKIFEKKHQFDTNKRFYTWAFTMASNMCKTEFRKKPVESIHGHPEAESFAVFDKNEAERKQLKARLKSEIQSLDYHHRSVFILRYIEKFSLQDIADITETSVGTVKSRLFYATKKLAHQLRDYQLNDSENYG